MRIIGVAGGIASGKSFVSGLLSERGAEVLDADKAGHEALQNPNVAEAIRERFGSDVFADDGQIDRKSLAAIVFASTAQGEEDLKALEKITHPVIRRSLEERIEQLRQLSSPPPAIVLDAPVMFKSGWDKFCDVILFTDASKAIRLSRVADRGWSEAEFNAREAHQESLDLKRSRANVIIDTNGDNDKTIAQVDHFWESQVVARANTTQTAE